MVDPIQNCGGPGVMHEEAGDIAVRAPLKLILRDAAILLPTANNRDRQGCRPLVANQVLEGV